MSLLDPLVNALGSIRMQEAHELVEAELLADWARDAEQAAIAAVGAEQWAANKEAIASRLENANIDFEDLTAAEAGERLVDAYRYVRSKEVSAEGKRQSKAVVKAAHAGSYRDLIRGDQ